VTLAAALSNLPRNVPRSLPPKAEASTTEYLNFEGWGFDDDYFCSLCPAMDLESVTVCNLSGNRLTYRSMSMLASRTLSNFRCLNLQGNRLGDRGGQDTGSDLKTLRPNCFVPASDNWLTAGAKHLRKRRGKLYHEVVLLSPMTHADPQLGWLTTDYPEGVADSKGVGDDANGWAADGVRHKAWHAGGAEAKWPQEWREGDVIGLAIDFAAGKMQFSLNGSWQDIPEMQFALNGSVSVFPAVSMKGRFVMNIPKATWKYEPPGPAYKPWASSGTFTRPQGDAALIELLSSARPNVRELNISDNRLSDQAVEALCHALVRDGHGASLQGGCVWAFSHEAGERVSRLGQPRADTPSACARLVPRIACT
jgi:hypothetical protein